MHLGDRFHVFLPSKMIRLVLSQGKNLDAIGDHGTAAQVVCAALYFQEYHGIWH